MTATDMTATDDRLVGPDPKCVECLGTGFYGAYGRGGRWIQGIQPCDCTVRGGTSMETSWGDTRELDRRLDKHDLGHAYRVMFLRALDLERRLRAQTAVCGDVAPAQGVGLCVGCDHPAHPKSECVKGCECICDRETRAHPPRVETQGETDGVEKALPLADMLKKVPPAPSGTTLKACEDAVKILAAEVRRLRASKPASDVDDFLAEVRVELTRARAQFPGDRIMTIALSEEYGELCKAILDEPASAVRKEAVQTAVMAARIVLDGDGSVKEWRASKGLDQLGKGAE